MTINNIRVYTRRSLFQPFRFWLVLHGYVA
jgi:hypothetical protein